MPDTNQLSRDANTGQPAASSSSAGNTGGTNGTNSGERAGQRGARPSRKRVRVVAPTDPGGDGGAERDDPASAAPSRKQARVDAAEEDEDNIFKPYEKKNDSKHTLDSDEELEEDHSVLDIEKIEGQEEKTAEFDGNIKLTPFNMEDEMEEGHFDSEGNFVFTKNDNELKDAWMDEIDWNNVKARAGKQWHKMDSTAQNADDEDDAAPELSSTELISIYEKILAILRPSESVAKALRRLGGNKNVNADRKQRWKKKAAEQALAAAGSSKTLAADSSASNSATEQQQSNTDDTATASSSSSCDTGMDTTDSNYLRIREVSASAGSSSKSAGDSGAIIPDTKESQKSSSEGGSQLIELTELVDHLVSQAQFDAYSYTFERVTALCDQLRPKERPVVVDEDLDMFADAGDETGDQAGADVVAEGAGTGVIGPEQPTVQSSEPKSDENDDGDNEVKWMLKWTEAEDAELHGPMTSSQMLQWQEAGYFKNGVWVRQVGKESGHFYSAERIDFDLYI